MTKFSICAATALIALSACSAEKVVDNTVDGTLFVGRAAVKGTVGAGKMVVRGTGAAVRSITAED